MIPKADGDFALGSDLFAKRMAYTLGAATWSDGKGPAFQLRRAAAGEDENCVRVTRMVGPDGRVYVTRGLICQE